VKAYPPFSLVPVIRRPLLRVTSSTATLASGLRFGSRTVPEMPKPCEAPWFAPASEITTNKPSRARRRAKESHWKLPETSSAMPHHFILASPIKSPSDTSRPLRASHPDLYYAYSIDHRFVQTIFPNASRHGPSTTPKRNSIHAGGTPQFAFARAHLAASENWWG
jgi:hypothetical protein